MENILDNLKFCQLCDHWVPSDGVDKNGDRFCGYCIWHSCYIPYNNQGCDCWKKSKSFEYRLAQFFKIIPIIPEK